MAMIFQTVALFADIGSVFLAFRLGYALRYRLELGGEVDAQTWSSWSSFAAPALAATLIMLAVFPLRGVYQIHQKLSALDYVPRIVGGYTIVIAGVIMLAFFFQFMRSRLIFLYAGVLGLAFMFAHRLVAASIRKWFWRRGIGVDRVLIVGVGKSGRRLMQSMIGDAGLGYRLIGYAGGSELADGIQVATERGVLTCPRLGGLDDVRDLVVRHRIDDVVMVDDRQGMIDVREVLDQCRGTTTQFRIVPDLVQISLDRVDFSEIGGIPTFGVRDASIQGWNAVLKRTGDTIFSLAACVGGLIPMAVVALLIKRDSEGPEMVESTRDADGRLFKDSSDPRITRIGRILRRYSLDELPQLINVLRGEMSIVGPRPPLPPEVALYDEWHMQRLLVRPGLTGLWQVNGRSHLSFDDMVRLDLYYAENWTLWLDIKILLRTVPAVIFGRGAY